MAPTAFASAMSRFASPATNTVRTLSPESSAAFGCCGVSRCAASVTFVTVSTPGPLGASSRAGRGSVGGVPRLLIVADTHVPKRARELPAQLWAEVDRADVVVHAGDWVDVALLDALLERLARRPGPPGEVVGVYGNNDGPPLRARLPEVARGELGGVRVAVVHETGPAQGRE